jgi:hypothetical protein
MRLVESEALGEPTELVPDLAEEVRRWPNAVVDKARTVFSSHWVGAIASGDRHFLRKVLEAAQQVVERENSLDALERERGRTISSRAADRG